MCCAGTGVLNGPIARPEETYCLCARARVDVIYVISYNDKPLHLDRVQTEK